MASTFTLMRTLLALGGLFLSYSVKAASINCSMVCGPLFVVILRLHSHRNHPESRTIAAGAGPITVACRATWCKHSPKACATLPTNCGSLLLKLKVMIRE